MRPRSLTPLVILVMLLGLLNTALLTELILYGRNTPEHHPEWLVGKVLLEIPVMGGELTVKTRNLLAHNRLNLDAWHGFQEVLLNRPGRADRVNLRFRLAERAYLLIMLDKTREGFTGIRLSRNPDFPSVFVRANGDGRFLERQPLALSIGAGWQRLRLVGSQLEVGAQRVTLPSLVLRNGCFGVRGSHAPVQVDDVEVWEGPRPLVVENFRNHQLLPALAAALALVLLLTALVVRRRECRTGWLWGVLVHLALAWMLGMALGFDYLYWSPRYHQRNDNLFDAEAQPAERHRQNLFGFLDFLPDPSRPTEVLGVRGGQHIPYRLQVEHGEERGRLHDDKRALQEPLPPGPRVLVLGSSQTYGEGATRLAEALVPSLARERPEWVIVNAGMRGSESFNLVERYLDYLVELKPDLVVVNLGNNDRQVEPLRQSLTKLAQTNRERHIPTVFVLEANTPEISDKLPQNHAVMREIAARYDIPLLDLHARLSRPEVRDSGVLWWDMVHPTAWGHKLAGRWLGQELRR